MTTADDHRIGLDPPLDPSEVAFLAGFGAAPVRDHDGEAVLTGAPARVWPGQPRSLAPVSPCAAGCCLRVRPRRGGEEPGHTAQWLRFLVDTFLAARHRVDGAVEVPVRGGGTELVVVEDGEVFEGLLDPPVSPGMDLLPGPRLDPPGGWPA